MSAYFYIYIMYIYIIYFYLLFFFLVWISWSCFDSLILFPGPIDTKEWALHLGGFWGFAMFCHVFSIGVIGCLVVYGCVCGILVLFVWFWLWLGSAVGSLCRQCLLVFVLLVLRYCYHWSLSLKVVSARLVADTITATTAITSMTKTTTSTSLWKYRLH